MYLLDKLARQFTLSAREVIPLRTGLGSIGESLFILEFHADIRYHWAIFWLELRTENWTCLNVGLPFRVVIRAIIRICSYFSWTHHQLLIAYCAGLHVPHGMVRDMYVSKLPPLCHQGFLDSLGRGETRNIQSPENNSWLWESTHYGTSHPSVLVGGLRSVVFLIKKRFNNRGWYSVDWELISAKCLPTGGCHDRAHVLIWRSCPWSIDTVHSHVRYEHAAWHRNTSTQRNHKYGTASPA